MIKNNKVLLSTLIWMATTVWSALYSFAARAEQPLDKFIHSVMKERNIPGLQLAVVKDDKIVKLGSYGVADLQHNVPVTDKTLFPINSMTKAFTGVALVQLVDQGVISLDDQIGKHLTDLPKSWQSLTIRQLMAHTTGLPEILASKSTLDLIVPGDIEASWQEVQRRPFLFEPNSRFEYNQTGYILIGKLLDKYTPNGFTNFIIDKQFKPVGMKQTAQAGFDYLDVVIPNQTRQYYYVGNGVYGNFYGQFPYMLRTAASMSSTASELANYMIALQNEQLVKDVSVLWQPAKLNNGRTEGFNHKENGYAVGWQVGQRKYHPSISASGGNATTMITYPKDDVAIVVLTNLLGGLPITFVDDIAAYYIEGFNQPHKLASYDPQGYLEKLTQERGFDDFASTLAQAESDLGVTYDIDMIGEWGNALAGEKRYDDAMKVLQFTLSMNDKNSFFHFWLARAYEAQEQYAEALTSYQNVLKLNPNAQFTKQRVAALKAQLKL
ncbi:serine hydrolase [Pseudoalteromonas sp. T1lg65]|uniref:serine hydrolase n=1 Tax=Pseudoalteromonas sp. T1lg65 TaxID=2077101 RepID=UPI003F7AEC57